jgi:hypothetical protein
MQAGGVALDTELDGGKGRHGGSGVGVCGGLLSVGHDPVPWQIVSRPGGCDNDLLGGLLGPPGAFEVGRVIERAVTFERTSRVANAMDDDAAAFEASLRSYHLALADYRLGRTDGIGPCVAALVDAGLLIGDPAEVLQLGVVGDQHVVYDALGAMLYEDLVAAVAAAVSAGQDGRLHPDEVGTIVRAVFTNCFDSVGDTAIDDTFRGLIDSQFELSGPLDFSEVDGVVRIDPRRLERLIELLSDQFSQVYFTGDHQAD